MQDFRPVTRVELDKIKDDLQRMRDELQLKAHLGSKEFQDSFEKLKKRTSELEQQVRDIADDKRIELKASMLKAKSKFESLKAKLPN
ncbi:MAG: hypothetical protein IPJ88_08205 [Myxococcales bacterium]|nr:MAG: hypothetical protein IPJ88_08205 [Myxococcales bacterium]